jgi:hypothetical protein
VQDTVDFAAPFQSMQAVLEIESAKLEEGDYGPQIRIDMKVVDDGKNGEENGILFGDWFGFGKQQNPDKPRITPRSKAGQLIRVTIGEPKGSLEIADLVGYRFRAQVSHNKAGTYSKVVSDTLMPAPVAKDGDDLEGIDVRESALRWDYRRLLSEMSSRREEAAELRGAVWLFLKVSKSYWKGLFRCYRIPEGTLPRINNDLEHLFGSARYAERRASGRRNASPAMVVRGSVRVVAAVATPPEGFDAQDIRPADVQGWRTLRASLEKRRESRRAQLRFRRDPDAYLGRLEEQLLRQALPS